MIGHVQPLNELTMPWIGRMCSAVERLEHSWGFGFGDAGGMNAECLWRIIADGRIALCAGDDGQQFGLPAPIDARHAAQRLLVGRRVLAIVIQDITSDLRVTFDGGVMLELLNNSSGYESWNASFRDKGVDTQLIALGGGQLHILRIDK
jgi:hypothetical protein